MQQSSCSLFKYVIAILLITASCGDEMVAPTSGAAGMVITIEGQVNATRGSETTRLLKEGDVVFVKDTLKTAEDASVTILLTHNRARWSLGGGKEKLVQKSVAWRAATQKDSLLAEDEALATAVAAANTGKVAGESRDTAIAAAAEQEQPVASPDPAATPEFAAGNAPMEATLGLREVEEKVDPKPEERKRDTRVGHKRQKRKSNGEPKSVGKGGGGETVPPRGSAQPSTPTAKPEPVVEPPRSYSRPTADTTTPPAPPPPLPRSTPETKRPPPGDTDSRSPSPGGSPPAKASRKASENFTQEFVRKIAKRCHDTKKGTGSISYVLTVRDGKLASFRVTKSSASLAPLVACLKAKIGKEDSKKLTSTKGKLSFTTN